MRPVGPPHRTAARSQATKLAGLGTDVQAFCPDGKPAVATKGELACCSPFPSQPTGSWNDFDGEKYRKAYFDHFDGVCEGATLTDELIAAIKTQIIKG